MFATLFAGLCAIVIEHGALPVIADGYITRGECSYRLMLPDGGGQETPPLAIKEGEPRRFMAQIKRDRAFLFVDDIMFDLPRGEAL